MCNRSYCEPNESTNLEPGEVIVGRTKHLKSKKSEVVILVIKYFEETQAVEFFMYVCVSFHYIKSRKSSQIAGLTSH